MDLNILNNTPEDTESGSVTDFQNAHKCLNTGISDLRTASASVRQANQKLFERKKSVSRDPGTRKSRNNGQTLALSKVMAQMTVCDKPKTSLSGKS